MGGKGGCPTSKRMGRKRPTATMGTISREFAPRILSLSTRLGIVGGLVATKIGALVGCNLPQYVQYIMPLSYQHI